MSLNRIVLVGRLTRDPELKYTPQGIAVASMGIAVDRFTKDAEGNYETDFFNVVAWRRSAEFASNYLTKGRLVSIDGRLQARQWVDQTTGAKRTAYEIVAENINGLDRRPDAENPEGHPDAGDDTDDFADEPANVSQAAALPAPAPAPKPATRGATATASRPPAAAKPIVDARAAKQAQLKKLQDELAASEIDESDPFADE